MKRKKVKEPYVKYERIGKRMGVRREDKGSER